MQRRLSSRQSLMRRITGIVSPLRDYLTATERWVVRRINQAPMASFFAVLGTTLALIVVGNFLRRPDAGPGTAQPAVKPVSVFAIGSSPRLEVSGRVEKSGVITVVAQTAGIVQQVYVREGSPVSRGTGLFSFSTNYQGGVLPSVQRQIAQKNFEYVLSNYDTQKDLIAKRRDIANTADTQSDDFRNITDRSLEDTRNLISLNEEISRSLDTQLAYLESVNVNGASDSAILQVRQAKSGVLAALSSLRSGVRNAEYQSSPDKAPARISDLNRELANAQLDLESKALDLNREISELNLKVARIGESLMYPVSPVTGTVERVSVRFGDAVAPGTVLATVKGTKTAANVVVTVSGDIASRLSRLEPSDIRIGSETVRVMPGYVSTEPTDGSLHSVTYTLPEEYVEWVPNKSYVTVAVPVAVPASTASVPFIPIDAVYQTQTESYVFVASSSASGKRTAQSRAVSLGRMMGSFVEVTGGIRPDDMVITDRTVSAGDPVTLR